jgi:transcriptional regulator with GAF, ATPase, and Fis domain
MSTPEALVTRAHLHAAGPDGPLSFPLAGTSLVVGRSVQADVRIADPRVSRRHAKLVRSKKGWTVEDLGSQNGVLVNGRRIEGAAPLKSGDILQLGGMRLEFSLDDAVEEKPTRRAATEEGSVTQAIRGLSREARAAQRLRRVGELMKAFSQEVGSDVFFQNLIDAAVDLTGAERGFVIVNGKQGAEFRAARNIADGDRRGHEFEVSWSIAVKVGTTGEGVLLVDALQDPRFASIESVEQLKLRSVLCVPIRSSAGVQGVVYLDHRLTRGAFSADDRDAVEVLADQAGVALEKERLAKDLRRRREEVETLNRRLKERVDEQETELRRVRAALGGGADDPDVGYRSLVGSSARMDELRSLLAKASATDLPVLIVGESGSGKELVARCLHKNGPRRGKAFLAVNCASFPETLLENELFGHAKGAFTGADQARKGLLEAAHGGTLFLDEIECMSAAMQSRLLRALQEGEVRPVGGQVVVKVDVRVVAASNADVKKLVADGKFREDLYYRLRVLQVFVPPLRDRREDVPALAAHFLKKHAPPGAALTPEALDVLQSYAWPGNVRELENELRRCAVLSGPIVGVEALSKHVVDGVKMLVGEESSFHDLNALVESIESREILKALRRSDGNKTKAATLLGISRFTLQRKLDKYGIAADD